MARRAVVVSEDGAISELAKSLSRDDDVFGSYKSRSEHNDILYIYHRYVFLQNIGKLHNSKMWTFRFNISFVLEMFTQQGRAGIGNPKPQLQIKSVINGMTSGVSKSTVMGIW